MRAAGIILAVATLALAIPLHAAGVVDNVNGIALDRDGKLIHFDALIIDDQGKITKLVQGKVEEPRSREKKRRKKGDDTPPAPSYSFRLDGQGRTLIPGMIDAHGHVMGLGLSLLTLDLTDTKSLAEAQAKIAAYVKDNPGRKWILGGGWNQESWGLGRFPTAAELDAVTGDVPTWLERVDGHAGWANSAAMRAAGITPATKAPAGGRIETAAGKPAGVFVDAARGLIDRVVPPPAPKDRDLAFAKAQYLLLSQGITGIADMGADLNDWQTYRRAGDRDRLRVRIMVYAKGIENMVAIAGAEPTPWLYGDRLRMGGVKLLMDGALGSRGAWLKADYSDAPGQRGLPLMTGAQLRNNMSRAAMDGFQVAVHAIGDQANAEVVDAIAELSETYKGDRRWRVEHAQIIDPTDLPRFAQNGTIASMQPVHEASDWRMAMARMGEARLKGAYAWRTMLNAHVPLAFGSDVPVESSNPFPGISVAMTREDAKGEPAGGWMPEQRLTLEEAMAAFTRGGAYAGFAEDRFGTLAPGEQADFLIIDRDISTTRPAEIRNIQVIETWIGGKRVYVKGETAPVETQPNEITGISSP
ncbi:amidohydrolase [Sphingobium phenoxybenzoativorans]|uniref:Amidohydrolase n=1 Tax=Sphingobium phenoxybenzoativorans TaxID=1592790 RepID=A0A975Q074_9SPHN|nr:amidohydrolase [Sphingobium phenoxybenzoativorans]QUT04331.1 amidohydrolase [Sphingobium phenoxybenzoativorans]